MAAFEIKLKKDGLLPRVWHRYVDDVFAIVHKNEIKNDTGILLLVRITDLVKPKLSYRWYLPQKTTRFR